MHAAILTNKKCQLVFAGIYSFRNTVISIGYKNCCKMDVKLHNQQTMFILKARKQIHSMSLKEINFMTDHISSI